MCYGHLHVDTGYRSCVDFSSSFYLTRSLIVPTTVLGLCVIITWSTLQHIKDGRRDALYHPTCRFNPNAPSPIALLGVHHRSMHRIPQSGYTATMNTSMLELGELPAYPYSTHPPSQESYQEFCLDNHSPSTVTQPSRPY